MLIFLTGKSNHDYMHHLTDSFAFTQSLASLENLIINLRKKKQEATNLRKKAEKQLQEARLLERRSSSGLHSIDRKIESEREDAIDVSDILNQKTSQIESIERLVAAAKERIIREKETLSQTEQELEFAQNPEEKQYAESRLISLNDHIKELEYEIKNREKTAKKIVQDIAQYNEIKSKISSKIQQQSKSKPSLREKISTSHKDAQKFIKDLEQKTRAEASATKSLGVISSKLKELLTKKRTLSQKHKSTTKRKSPTKTTKRKSPTKTTKRKSPTKTTKRKSPTKTTKRKSPTKKANRKRSRT
jgi:chromosome segregation ATPase